MEGRKNNKSNPLELGKIPPQSIEMEEALLGALMLESSVMSEVENIIQKGCFYKDAHNDIFECIITLYDNSEPIDLLTVHNKAKTLNKLENIGGPAYLSQLTQKVASGAHAEFHARIIMQKFMQRELIRISTEITNKAFEDLDDINELIEFSQNEINQLSLGNIKKFAKKLGDIGRDHIKVLEERNKDNEIVNGVPSLPKIDRLTSGWQPANLIILAARPGIGKSMLAQFFARKAAEHNKPTAIFSLEMAQTEIYERELSAQAGIENIFIRRGNFSENDWINVENAQRRIEDLEIYIDDTPALKVSEFKSKARLLRKKHKIELIIVDYLQLMKHPDYKWNREREISEISGSLKAMAKELNIPIIALSQLNRDIDKRTDPKPKLADLRESGAIEQDADIIIFPHRPEALGIEIDENGNSTKNRIDLIFAKFRGGVPGTHKLWKTTNWTEITEGNSTDNDGELAF